MGLAGRAGDSFPRRGDGLSSRSILARPGRRFGMYVRKASPMNGEHDSADLARFADITRKLQVHDPSGMDALRTMFDGGLRLLLVRRGVLDTERISGIVLSRAADLVRRRTPSDPAALPSQLRTAMNEIQPRVGRAGIAMQPAETAEARELLAQLDECEREALLRFYLREQQPAQICRELGLDEQVFSAIKSRVRAKYRELRRGTIQQ
jgi:hypothetical protein